MAGSGSSPYLLDDTAWAAALEKSSAKKPIDLRVGIQMKAPVKAEIVKRPEVRHLNYFTFAKTLYKYLGQRNGHHPTKTTTL